MSKFTSVSIMLGTVTETDSLRKTVETLEEVCNPEDTEEILVGYPPDQVTDECKAVIDEVCARSWRIKVLPVPQKRPFMAGILDAVDAAKGSHCILFASDMALDLSCVPVMTEKAKEEPDTIVSCSRFLPGCTLYDYGTLKKILNICAQAYMRVLYGVRLTDFTNPSQIAPVELYRSINFEETGFPFLLEMVLKPLRLGCKFAEIPTNCYPRTDGKSRNSKKQTFMYLKTSLHIRFMKKSDILKK